jgi:hypothetical protein
MKRTGVLLVAILLALPTVALGLTRTLHGPAGPATDASVDIAFKYKGHHAKVITRFELNNIPIACAGGRSSAVSYKFAHHIPVSSTGKFHATEKPAPGLATYKVKGRFTGVHKAAGTLRVTGTVPACSSGDTGVVHWSATPAAPGT